VNDKAILPRPNTEAIPHRGPGNGAARAYERAGMTSPLDGAPAEPVGAEAKDLAAKQLAKLAARKAAKKAAKPAAPAAVKPAPAPTSLPETPEQLRTRGPRSYAGAHSRVHGRAR
jgi:sRNA-binding protein